MKRLLALLPLAVAACTQAPAPPIPPPAPMQVCPPSPPAGSGFVCAPPLPCRLDPTIMRFDREFAPYLPQRYAKYGAALGHLGQAIEDLCQ